MLQRCMCSYLYKYLRIAYWRSIGVFVCLNTCEASVDLSVITEVLKPKFRGYGLAHISRNTEVL